MQRKYPRHVIAIDYYDSTVLQRRDDAFDEKVFAQKLNARLGELNSEYHAKTQSGRVKGADIKRLRLGTANAYKASCIMAGQREGQFKLIKLQYRADVSFPFEECIVS